MDGVIEFLTGLFAFGALVPFSAVIRPWGPFKRRWIGAAAVVPFVLAFSFFHDLPPTRPANVPQGEWDRRIVLCRQHADGEFRDCVRNDAKLKEAEKKAAEAKEAKTPKERDPGTPKANDGHTSSAASDASKISDGVLEPYTRKNDPDIFAQWGTKGVQHIEVLRKTAARAVAKKNECDLVDGAEIADRRSKPPAKIVIHVFCRNLTEYFLSQAEIEHGFQSEAERLQQVEDDSFVRACIATTKSMLDFPSTFKARGGESFKTDEGNYGYAIPFEAKNGFGNKVPLVARCTMRPNGNAEVVIRPR